MKIFLQTYGCQMNEYDTELVRRILSDAGFVFAQDELAADVVLLNTCSVRENAHRKVYGHIHTLRHKRNTASPAKGGTNGGTGGNPVMIGILGCMATSLRNRLLEDKHLNIDFIAGPDSYKRLPELIRQTQETGKKTSDFTLSEFETYSDIYPKRTDGVNPSTPLRVNAWLAVMRGCNNFCTFCIVPYTRGRERSRSVSNVVEEAKRLADEGFKQVTLLGQNVNSYNHEGTAFADLLEEVSKVEGIERIRFTSPHPKDFPDKLLDLMANNKKICNHVHLPLQAGSNRILELMNRTYTKEDFLALVKKMRERVPDIAITTDIIAGFPTETDAEFEDTVSVMKEADFDAAFIFKYSPREGTIAERKYKDDVADDKKAGRTVRLNELQTGISLKKNQAHIGETHQILMENQKEGRTTGNKRVILPESNYAPGQLIRAKITDATPHLLKGEAA